MTSHLNKTVKTIATHSGMFHCDEVLGCSLLKVIYPDAEIIRTRDQKLLDTCDLVLDVGGEYNLEKLRFDHHQSSFSHTFGSVLNRDKFTKVKLSSAGLIYCHFGMEILKKLSPVQDKNFIEKLFENVYEHFIQEIDGIDNGIPMFDGEPLYYISSHLSARVGRFNTPWNETENFDEKQRFTEAMALTTSEFTESIEYYSKSWWPARLLVLEAMKDRFNVHVNGKIIELKNPCPWKGHFFELEKELNIVNEIRFVIFPGDGNYRVQAVSLSEKSYILRTPLYKDWMGIRDEELSKVADISGCIFVHANGFIGGNKTREGAILMALKTMELTEKDQSKEKLLST